MPIKPTDIDLDTRRSSPVFAMSSNSAVALRRAHTAPISRRPPLSATVLPTSFKVSWPVVSKADLVLLLRRKISMVSRACRATYSKHRLASLGLLAGHTTHSHTELRSPLAREV